MNRNNSDASNGLQVFNNPQFGKVRTAGTSEQPLFCLADVCKAVKLKNPSSVKKRLDTEDVQLLDLHALKPSEGKETIGNTMATFITESGFYDVLFYSDSPNVKPFRKWVTSEVLPSIRKTGGYIVEKQDDTPEEIMARALTIAQETLAKRENRIAQLEAESQQQQAAIEVKDETIAKQTDELRKQAPKVSYYDDVLQSANTMTTTQIAKGLGMEVRALNNKLKEIGVIFRQSGMWMLKAPYSQWKMSSVRTQTYTRSDGTTGTSSYTVWSERGRRFITALADNEWKPKLAIASISGKGVQA